MLKTTTLACSVAFFIGAAVPAISAEGEGSSPGSKTGGSTSNDMPKTRGSGASTKMKAGATAGGMTSAGGNHTGTSRGGMTNGSSSGGMTTKDGSETMKR